MLKIKHSDEEAKIIAAIDKKADTLRIIIAAVLLVTVGIAYACNSYDAPTPNQSNTSGAASSESAPSQ